MSAGDAVMSRLWEFVQYDDGRVDEQIDKFSGAQVTKKLIALSYNSKNIYIYLVF